MPWFAHSVKDRGREAWQPLAEHLTGVSGLAHGFAARFGAERAAALAGLLHDLGKYTAKFQKRLEGGAKVDHATAGAFHLMSLKLPGFDGVMAQVLAHIIAGHHSGLDDRAGLNQRLDGPFEKPDPVWMKEIVPEIKSLMPPLCRHQTRAGFQLGFLGRMIFSCLIDADRRNTRTFDRSANRLPAPDPSPNLSAITDHLIAAFDAHVAGLGRSGKVNLLRKHILSEVRAKAPMLPGFFTLTVPTGGGKTLASLGFALDHVKAHADSRGLNRIIYTIPFTSVIDQTVGIFTNLLGDDVVLAHHSGLEPETAKDEEKISDDPAKKMSLAMATWDVPVVVTTNVQFFESLFSHRPSRCRKLHSIAKSVIVLDEAQTIPLHVLRPCLAALDELVRNYGCSVVICTATQPAVTEPRFVGGLDIGADRELAPDPPALYEALRRVTARHGGIMSDDDLVRALAGTSSGLVIVNTRGHALALFRTAGAAKLDNVIHLTTRQYAAHRRCILADIRQRLTEREPCRVVATSLVEAGVDLDFNAVWRAEAGLDSIAQAAGRCNREGERRREESFVTVFKPIEVKPPREIKGLIGDMERALQTQEDMLSPQAIEHYFREVYWRKGDKLDRDKILDACSVTGTKTNMAYRMIGETFKLIEDGMAPVIIPRDPEAQAALRELRENPNVRAGTIARELQPFIVQVPPRARALLLAENHVAFEAKERFADQFCVLQAESLYTEAAGLLWETPEYMALESYII